MKTIIYYLLFLGFIVYFVWHYKNQTSQYANFLKDVSSFKVISNTKKFLPCVKQEEVEQLSHVFMTSQFAVYVKGNKLFVYNSKDNCFWLKFSGPVSVLDKVYLFAPGIDAVLLGTYNGRHLNKLSILVFSSTNVKLVELASVPVGGNIFYQLKSNKLFSYLVLLATNKEKTDIYIITLDSYGNVQKAYVGSYNGKLKCLNPEVSNCIDNLLESSKEIRNKYLRLIKIIR